MTKISYARYRFPPEIIPRQISYDLLQGHGRARALRSRNREAVMMATGNDLSRRRSRRPGFGQRDPAGGVA
jgi:hypothetical protein